MCLKVSYDLAKGWEGRERGKGINNHQENQRVRKWRLYFTRKKEKKKPKNERGLPAANSLVFMKWCVLVFLLLLLRTGGQCENFRVGNNINGLHIKEILLPLQLQYVCSFFSSPKLDHFQVEEKEKPILTGLWPWNGYLLSKFKRAPISLWSANCILVNYWKYS